MNHKVTIRTIRIYMHDGILSALTDVRHVLNLERNFLSLGMFDSHGCKYINELEN